jgi:hypothetical protein
MFRRGSETLFNSNTDSELLVYSARSGKSNDKNECQIFQQALTSRWSSQSSQSKKQFESFSQLQDSVRKRSNNFTNDGLDSLRQEGNFI